MCCYPRSCRWHYTYNTLNLNTEFNTFYFNTFYLNTFYFNTFYFKTAMSQPALTTAAQQGDNPSVLSAPASS